MCAAGPGTAQVANDTFRVVTIHTPPEIARTDTLLGQYPIWGQQPPPGGITAPLVLALDSLGRPSEACWGPDIANQSELAGAIVVFERGTCDFELKATVVQSFGAFAYLAAQDDRVPDSDCDKVVFMGCGLCHPGELIPGAFLPRCIAVAIYPTLLAGVAATATMAPLFVSTGTGPARDRASIVTLELAPNPAGDEVQIVLTISRPAAARVAVHDAVGRQVALLHDGDLPAGSRALALDTTSLRAGRYFVRAVSDARSTVRPFSLAR